MPPGSSTNIGDSTSLETKKLIFKKYIFISLIPSTRFIQYFCSNPLASYILNSQYPCLQTQTPVLEFYNYTYLYFLYIFENQVEILFLFCFLTALAQDEI